MANKPNKMGRIEGTPKVRWYKKIKWQTVGTVLTVAALVAVGVMGTLQYQKFIAGVKAEGVAEFKSNSCDPYANDKGQKWLECDE